MQRTRGSHTVNVSGVERDMERRGRLRDRSSEAGYYRSTRTHHGGSMPLPGGVFPEWVHGWWMDTLQPYMHQKCMKVEDVAAEPGGVFALASRGPSLMHRINGAKSGWTDGERSGPVDLRRKRAAATRNFDDRGESCATDFRGWLHSFGEMRNVVRLGC